MFEEHLHFFVEECDSLQGFQLLADVGGGFGGLSCCFAEELADQFDQKGLLSFSFSSDTVLLDKVQHALIHDHRSVAQRPGVHLCV